MGEPFPGELLPCERLVIVGGLQVRKVLSETIIQAYADALRRGVQFPPIDVYFDGHIHWLADGLHRLEAAKRVGHTTIAIVCYPGGKREALLHRLGANEAPGRRRTNADRRNAVHMMLADAEWREWSDQQIARHCNVSEGLVRSLRRKAASAQDIHEAPARPLPGGPMIHSLRYLFSGRAHRQDYNPWTLSVAELQRDAEWWARILRYTAFGLALLTAGWVVFITLFALSPDAYSQDVKWAIARLSVLVLLATLLPLVTRIVWNFSNVWLGRAGTLEDLILALRLIGMSPAETEVPETGDAQVTEVLSMPLDKEDADRLHVVGVYTEYG